MYSKFKNSALAMFDFFMLAIGLNELAKMSEVVTSLFFLVFVGYILWSLYKVHVFRKSDSEKTLASFLSFYFSYILQAVDTIGKEKRLGSNKVVRFGTVFLSLVGGTIGASVVLYGFFTKTVFSLGYFIHYGTVALFVVIIPLCMLTLRTIASGYGFSGYMKNVFGLFTFKFVCLFAYFFTFFTPIGWLFIMMMSYLGTRASLNLPSQSAKIIA